MGAIAQYNPSTGAASYNTVTGKQQLIDTGILCPFCEDTPSQISVTISGTTTQNGCHVGIAGGDEKWIDWPDINNTYTLTLNTTQLPGECRWNFGFTLPSPAIIESYNSTDGSCTDLNSTVEKDGFFVTAATNGTINAIIVQFGVSPRVFETGAVPVESGCIGISSANNLRNDDGRPIYGGSGSVSEI